MLIKILIVLALLAIVISLASGFFSLMRDESTSRSRATVRALTWRIGLSIALFVLIMLGLATGVIESNPSPYLTTTNG